MKAKLFAALGACLCLGAMLLPPLAQGQEEAPFFASLEPHKPWTFVRTAFLQGEGARQGYLNEELRFTLSVKKELGNSIYFGYSQKAYWQILDQTHSRPFRSFEHNPEVFWQFDGAWGLPRLRLGLWEHESNGEQTRYDAQGKEVNPSRSWNRSYLLALGDLAPGWQAGGKLWVLLDRKETKGISYYQDNPDLKDHLGNGELVLQWQGQQLGSNVLLRQGYLPQTLSLQGEATLKLAPWWGGADKGADLFLQAFSGYGDSLLDYNRRIDQVSLGFRLR